MSLFQALVLALLQGVTELFPISSLGHSVILPKLLGWNINQSAPYFLTFLVATHLATAIVLFGFLWRDWIWVYGRMVRCFSVRVGVDASGSIGWTIGRGI